MDGVGCDSGGLTAADSAGSTSTTLRPPAPVPFIVGCGRSGTTLLRAMLDSHPAMAIPSESHFMVPMARDRTRYEAPDGLRVELFVATLAAHRRFQRWDLSADDVRAALGQAPAVGLADGFRSVLALYAGRRGKSRFGDKTPGYVLEIPLLAELFPEAVFVHLLRDGRDVALSLRDVEFGTSRPGRAAARWARAVRRGRAGGSRLDPSRYCEVSYEELVTAPVTVLRRICDVLALPYDDSMLEYHRRAEEILAGTLLPERHLHVNEPPTSGLRDWRSQMSPGDVAVFEAVAGDLLTELGYERATSASSLLTRLRAARSAADPAARLKRALGRA